MPSSTRRSVSPSMPPAREVTVRVAHGSAARSGSKVASSVGELDAEHGGHQGQGDRRQAGRVKAAGHRGRPPVWRDHREERQERETGPDEERVAERSRRGAFQLCVEVALERGCGGTLARRRGSGVAKAGCRSGT